MTEISWINPTLSTAKNVLDTSMSPSTNKRSGVLDDNIHPDTSTPSREEEPGHSESYPTAGHVVTKERSEMLAQLARVWDHCPQDAAQWLVKRMSPSINKSCSVYSPPSISRRGAKKPMETNIASVHSEDLEVCINESVIPFSKKETYVRRISSKNLKLTENYQNMKSVFEASGIGCWLVEKDNKLKDGDHMGFITGDSKDAIVEMFRVVGVEERPVYDEENPKGFWEEIMNWESETDTLIISLVSVGDVEEGRVSWNEWKRAVNYKENYMPRGIRKVISPL